VVIGTHLLVDHWGAVGLADAPLLESVMRAAAQAAGATVLSVHLHPFAGGGVTGVALLAESHISVHTWPEHHYAAWDIFMCGDADTDRALAVLAARMRPDQIRVVRAARGTRPPQPSP
jgi:S-adenosylmethionine decarboxylase